MHFRQLPFMVAFALVIAGCNSKKEKMSDDVLEVLAPTVPVGEFTSFISSCDWSDSPSKHSEGRSVILEFTLPLESVDGPDVEGIGSVGLKGGGYWASCLRPFKQIEVLKALPVGTPVHVKGVMVNCYRSGAALSPCVILK